MPAWLKLRIIVCVWTLDRPVGFHCILHEVMFPLKRSTHVPVALVATIATMTVTGCGPRVTQTRRCVDPVTGVVLPESECDRTGGRGTTAGYYGGARVYPRWVYGGGGGNVIGSRASGFSFEPARGARVVSPSGHTIRRGGFGGSGRSIGG